MIWLCNSWFSVKAKNVTHCVRCFGREGVGAFRALENARNGMNVRECRILCVASMLSNFKARRVQFQIRKFIWLGSWLLRVVFIWNMCGRNASSKINTSAEYIVETIECRAIIFPPIVYIMNENKLTHLSIAINSKSADLLEPHYLSSLSFSLALLFRLRLWPLEKLIKLFRCGGERFPPLNFPTERFDSDRLRRTTFTSGILVNIEQGALSRQMYKQFIFGTSCVPLHSPAHVVNRWENIQTLRRRITFKIESVFRDSLTCWVAHQRISLPRCEQFVRYVSVHYEDRINIYGSDCRRENYYSSPLCSSAISCYIYIKRWPVKGGSKTEGKKTSRA